MLRSTLCCFALVAALGAGGCQPVARSVDAGPAAEGEGEGEGEGDFAAWSAFEPNNHLGGEDCADLTLNARFYLVPGEWNDDNCNAARPYACDVDVLPFLSTCVAGSSTDPSKASVRTRRCGDATSR